MERPAFTVTVNGTDTAATEHTVTITHQDMLRGETMLAATGEKGSLMLTTAWCWAALIRSEAYTGPWERFRDVDCGGIDTADPVTVDPT